MTYFRNCLVLTAALAAASGVFAAAIHVPADQPTIQAGIDAAATGDTVLVQPDTYVENINFNGKDITVGSLFLTTGDPYYIPRTVIDGDSSGTVATFENGEGPDAVLKGLTVANGGNAFFGGGIVCAGSDPSLEYLFIKGNEATVGGGIYCSLYSNPSLGNTLISSNRSIYGSGGGMYCDDSDPTITNVEFSGNAASGSGGAIGCNASSPILENVTMTGNSSGSGGGLSCWYGSNAVLTNVDISGNEASVHGGGVFCKFYSNPSFYNVMVRGNAADYGGGFDFVEDCSPELVNVAILDNTAYTSAGAISCGNRSNPTLVNVTASGNTAGFWGSAMYCYDSHPRLENTIFWNGLPEEIYFSIYNVYSSLTVSYSDIQFGDAGIVTHGNVTINWLDGNIDENPLFIDPDNGDYRLSQDSPCIDAGNPDFDAPGGGGCVIDMGAYEFRQGIDCRKMPR